MKRLIWSTPKTAPGHDYHEATLPPPLFEGVYIIWRQAIKEPSPPEILQIGRGRIAAQIKSHRNSPIIDRFSTPDHVLLMTWAECPRIHYEAQPAILPDSKAYTISPTRRSNFHPLLSDDIEYVRCRGQLRVTKFLIDQLKPIRSECIPKNVQPMEVNLPSSLLV